ncbi:MAG: flagellar basal body-associated FliL family protein [bacterium]|nr:flagellar basal body-associated FliL family protein [bacterium]
MECRYIQSQLSSFLDNTLIFSAPIKEHLETCSMCQDELSSIKRTIEITASIEEILSPTDFLSSVHEEIKKEVLPVLPEYNLSITKKYIVYAILLISAGLWFAKVFLFKGDMLRVIPIEKSYKTGSQTSVPAADYLDSSSFIAKNRISTDMSSIKEEKGEKVEKKLMFFSKVENNINPVSMEDDIMVFSEPKNILLPSYASNPQMDITTGSFPEQIPLKPRAKVLKIFFNEPIEKEELEEENTSKESKEFSCISYAPYAHYELGDFLVRLNDYNEVCSAQLRDVVLVYEVEKYANPEELDEKRDSIKDIIQGLVGSYDSQKIKRTESLKKELKERINTMLQEGKILQVGFKIVVE